ncbi:hypothetical protein [Rhizobium sp. R693]|uniref:hypothetical protein n=1 Tax=Rhizobium sp. R693 TaxID=1764276 RepID=UPI001FD9611D|nr:hypothetical protein [Rhizobium sp. R693]
MRCTKKPEDGTEIHIGFKGSRLFVQPSCQAHRPALDYPPRQTSRQVWVMGGVATIAKGDEI